MSFLWFLKLALKCFDHFAWPLLALGYPLCASVQAIETYSDKETEDLISYWILLSLIYLFEYAFSRLLLWFQFWSYFKLMIIFWLIIPDFRGASYTYNKLICACISLNSQAIICRLNNRRKFFVKEDDFLLRVDRYVKENGTEALEKLIASKDIPVMPNLAPSQNASPAKVETKGAVGKDTVGGELPQSSTHMEVQNEWTCALCHLPTTSEKNLNMHLQGRKHRAKEKALKAKNEPVPQKLNSDQSKEELKQKNIINHLNSDTEKGESVVNNGSKGEKEGMDHKVQQQQKKAQKPAATNHSKFRCEVCDKYCPCEITLASHKNGKKHLAKIKSLI